MLMKVVLAVFVIVSFCSCEKAISFKLSQSPAQLVVDASIENAKPPMVILSNSLDYFSKITPELLENSFVHGATVTISNNSRSQQLKEYANAAGGVANAIYYYTIDSANLANAFLGEFNTTYNLSITVNGKEYIGKTSITTVAKRLDSLWWQTAPGSTDTSKVILMGKITDPPGYGDYIRYFTKVDSGAFLPGLNSVYDDQITDGTVYSIQLEKGVDRNTTIDMNNYSFFTRGDDVTVKFCNIDKATFDFWRTMEYNYQSIGNPFSTPTQVLGNISNGALGYFGGYAAEYVSLVIPK